MSHASAPFREADLMPVSLEIERHGDGTIRLRSTVGLGQFDANLPRAFAESAAKHGEKPAIGLRSASGDWAYTSYAKLKRDVDAATQWLLDHVPRGSAMIVMAGNTLPAATLTIAAYAAGVIHCPIGTGYASPSNDYARLRHVIAKTKPKLIYVDANPAFAASVAEVAGQDTLIVSPDGALFQRPITLWSTVIATTPTEAVTESIAAIDPDDVGCYMLTSGSTGLPKVVRLTLTNLAANNEQGAVALGSAAGMDGDVLDWLPWHHAAGASVLRRVLLLGATLLVDEGKPAPGLFAESLRNLREVPVKLFNNVPLGYAMLVDAMETDPVLRRTFFSELRVMLFGGAGLPQSVYDRLQNFAVQETGCRIIMTTGYGMTETVAASMVVHYPSDRVGIGLPSPGVDVKLTPYDDRYEVRLRGPNIMRDYLDEAEKTAQAFDEEGFYRTGDLATFLDPANPEAGLAFAGRLSEEFKLSSGVWVYGGNLRVALLNALAPLATDVVLCDDNRDYLALLVWLAPAAPADALTIVADRLRVFNKNQHGASSIIRRVRLLDTPPAIGAHEMSDKGTINRRAMLDRRRADVDALYAEPPGPGVATV